MRIEVGWQRTATLVSKEVAQWLEGAIVLLLLSSVGELSLQKQDEQLLSIDLADLDIAVGVTIQQKLVAD